MGPPLDKQQKIPCQASMFWLSQKKRVDLKYRFLAISLNRELIPCTPRYCGCLKFSVGGDYTTGNEYI